jgi:membrane-associated phospholipid phosphatase
MYFQPLDWFWDRARVPPKFSLIFHCLEEDSGLHSNLAVSARSLDVKRIYTFAAVVLFILTVTLARASYATTEPSVVIQWNKAALQGVRDSILGPPMVARALAIVHTCMYDAWAAYDRRAVGTRLGGELRRPRNERTLANKNEAISFAAYRAAIDLFPGDKASVFDLLMAHLGYDVNDTSLDITTPTGIGNVACTAVLDFRHSDGSNQLGNMTASGVPYADYTGYTPVNKPSTVPVSDVSTVIDPNHWQPLRYSNGVNFVTPVFVGAQWYKVTPFAMTSTDEFLPFVSRFGPAPFGSSTYLQQAEELIALSAGLTDKQKIIAEYWANGPHSELPPGHWDLFAQFVSARDQQTVDDDAKMFFTLTNAIFDAGIAAWDAKRVFDSVRPVTAIPYLFHGQQIRAWGGPGLGTVPMDGSQWIPYQPSTFPTPPFPEYISGHSTFSAAGATILALWTGSERFGGSVTFLAGSSVIEPRLTPAKPVTLSWKTFHAAANQAGLSRRYGGIHFKLADLVGRVTGDLVGRQAWEKAQSYFRGDAE